MTCSSHFNIESEGSIPQLWNTVVRKKFSVYVQGLPLMQKTCVFVAQMELNMHKNL